MKVLNYISFNYILNMKSENYIKHAEYNNISSHRERFLLFKVVEQTLKDAVSKGNSSEAKKNRNEAQNMLLDINSLIYVYIRLIGCNSKFFYKKATELINSIKRKLEKKKATQLINSMKRKLDKKNKRRHH